MADALSNALSGGFGLREDEMDAETIRMLADSICILRGFGLFEVGAGAGVTGKALPCPIRGSSENDKVIFRDAHIKCPVNNRIQCPAANLRLGAKNADE